jgi:hypothetical protein
VTVEMSYCAKTMIAVGTLLRLVVVPHVVTGIYVNTGKMTEAIRSLLVLALVCKSSRAICHFAANHRN